MTPWLRLGLRAALVLTLALVAVSAYLRLSHAGIGCADWPACYGVIGEQETPAPGDAYGRLATAGAEHPTAAAAHRLLAGALGLVVLGLTLAAFARRGRGLPRSGAAAVLALTVFLAALGLASGGLRLPAVVVGNLLGGMAMVGLLWWLDRRAAPGARGVDALALVALAMIAGQTVLGALTSAHFAALACPALPDCGGRWWPGPALAGAFDLFSPLTLSADGRVVSGATQSAIHLAHRWGAVAAVALGALAAVRALRRDPARAAAWALLVLLLAEAAVGATAVITDVPLVLASAHNLLAAVMVMAAVSLSVEL